LAEVRQVSNSSMSRIFIIAKREFVVTVSRKGYIFAVLGLPLMFTMIFALTFLTTESAEKSLQSASAPIGIVDHARIVDFTLANSPSESEKGAGPVGLLKESIGVSAPRIIAYADIDKAIQDVREGKLSTVYVIQGNYLNTGEIVCYSPEKGIFAELAGSDRARLYSLIRASLVKDRVDGNVRQRVLAPGLMKHMKVSKHGEIQGADDNFQKGARMFGPFSMFLLLTMSIFFSSGYLLQSIAEEKQNRVIEVIWSSVEPMQLLIGKIIGLGAAGLLQVAFYVAIFVIPSLTTFAFFQVSLTTILLSLLYFVLGYLLFAGLMAGTGILGSSPQESGQMAAFWTLLSISPMFLLAAISENPNSLLARLLSYFPLTSPVTMLLRMTSVQVPWIDVFISVALLLVSIFLVVKGAAKLFRAAALMYGKRPNLREVSRWLREA
jgi:ABC-2 type transport system permease protein